jgi:predicted Zn-dependent protease with MMP-like domain
MKNFKNRINLDTSKLVELKTRTYVGIQSKYAPLLLNVIIANNNFPDEIKDCIIDNKMLEKILLESDFDFLINEFGKNITEFPEEFQKACI